jgi:hypothetical protein
MASRLGTGLFGRRGVVAVLLLVAAIAPAQTQDAWSTGPAKCDAGTVAALKQYMVGTWKKSVGNTQECQVMILKSDGTGTESSTHCANGEGDSAAASKWSITDTCQIVLMVTGFPPQPATPKYIDQNHFTVEEALGTLYTRNGS